MNIQSVNMANKYINSAKPALENTQGAKEAPVDTVSFKGKDPGKMTDFFAKVYGKHFINSDAVQSFSEKLYKTHSGNVTQHLQTLGSIITSSVYMKKTLTNESLDKDRRKTLAWNQGLVLGVSTLGAYTLSNVMGDMNKKLEYKYVAIQEQKMAKSNNVDAKKLAEMRKVFSSRLKGFRTLLPIVTFTLIYRYVSPVAITPVANWVSDKITAKKAEKAAKLAEAQQNLEMQKDAVEVNTAA